MKTEEALRKLQPLIPEAVRSWRESLPLLDSDTRHLLEQHIAVTTSQLLGSSRERVLLPPPPRKQATGRLQVGSVSYAGLSYPFGISEGELLQGLGIYGRSGAGKTNVVFGLIQQLSARGIPFLFLDWKRTCRHLLPVLGKPVDVYTPGRGVAPFAFNPLVPPPGMEERGYINHFVDVLGAAYTLGDGAKSQVQQALRDAYLQSGAWPALTDVLDLLERRSATGRTAGWKASAIRALQGLSFAGLLTAGTEAQERTIEGLLGRNTVIELDGLNASAKKFLVPLLMLWLFQYRLGRPDRERLRLVVVVEEAHHLLYRQEQRAEESLMNRMLRQCRELGIGMVVVDQHPHLISSAALGNMYASICLNLKEPSDISRASVISSLREEDKCYLGMLPVGQGIVKLQDRWPWPFLVQFPDASVDKGAVSDADLRACTGGIPAGSASQTPEPAPAAGVRRVRLADVGISEDARRLVLDCAAHPADPVRARYKRLGLSVDRGTKAKRELLLAGLVQSAWVPVGRTRRLIVRPTREARRILLLGPTASPESVEHEFWKHYYGEKLKKAGYQVELEAPRKGGRIDVLGRTRHERVAIEVETGKSDPVGNVRGCLGSRVSQVVVVCTTKEARAQVVKARLVRSTSSSAKLVHLREPGKLG